MYDALLEKYRIILRAETRYPSKVPEYIQTWVYNTADFNMEEHACSKVYFEDDGILFYFVEGLLDKTGDYTKFFRIPRAKNINKFIDVILADEFTMMEDGPRTLFMLSSFFIQRHMAAKLITREPGSRGDIHFRLASDSNIIAFRNAIKATREVYTGVPLLGSQDLDSFVKTLASINILKEYKTYEPIKVQVKVLKGLADVFLSNDNVIQSGGLFKLMNDFGKENKEDE